MQILTNNQVKYCNLEIKTGENIECVPGIYFQDKLFVKSKFFLTEHWIHHVVDQQPFKNDFLFYRFYWDED